MSSRQQMPGASSPAPATTAIHHVQRYPAPQPHNNGGSIAQRRMVPSPHQSIQVVYQRQSPHLQQQEFASGGRVIHGANSPQTVVHVINQQMQQPQRVHSPGSGFTIIYQQQQQQGTASRPQSTAAAAASPQMAAPQSMQSSNAGSNASSPANAAHSQDGSGGRPSSTHSQQTGDSSAAVPPLAVTYEERLVLKCVTFFKTLLKLQGSISNLVVQLLREALLSDMSADLFTAKLREVTKSQDKGNLLPFLKSALPLLRRSIRAGEQAELRQALALDAEQQGGTTESHSPTAPEATALPTPLQQPVEQVAPSPTHQQPMTIAQFQQQPVYLGNQQSQVLIVQTPPQLAVPVSAANYIIKRESTAPANQPQALAPSPLAAESSEQRSSAPPPLASRPTIVVPSSLQNLPRMLLSPQALADRILAHMPDAEGVDADVLSVISMATEARLRHMLAHMAMLAEHRQQPLRIHPAYKMVDEPRKQIRFMEEIDKRANESRETAEKEALMKITKSKGKDKDALEKAKQLQKADREAMVQREANAAAFAALGGSRAGIKRQFPGAGGAQQDWKAGMQNQGLGDGLTGAKGRPMARVKRITMRDLQHYLCIDPSPLNARLRLRTALSTLAMDENNPA